MDTSSVKRAPRLSQVIRLSPPEEPAVTIRRRHTTKPEGSHHKLGGKENEPEDLIDPPRRHRTLAEVSTGTDTQTDTDIDTDIDRYSTHRHAFTHTDRLSHTPIILARIHTYTHAFTHTDTHTQAHIQTHLSHQVHRSPLVICRLNQLPRSPEDGLRQPPPQPLSKSPSRRPQRPHLAPWETPLLHTRSRRLPKKSPLSLMMMCSAKATSRLPRNNPLPRPCHVFCLWRSNPRHVSRLPSLVRLWPVSRLRLC